MKRYGIALLLGCIIISSCTKNMVSKIPRISFVAFIPKDSMIVNIDTTWLEFKLTDGDGDIGNDTVSVIHVKDIRTDTMSETTFPFPEIDATVEDPKKGLTGVCIFSPGMPAPRADANHQTHGDTLYYEVYITDRANNESNHIITNKFVVRN